MKQASLGRVGAGVSRSRTGAETQRPKDLVDLHRIEQVMTDDKASSHDILYSVLNYELNQKQEPAAEDIFYKDGHSGITFPTRGYIRFAVCVGSGLMIERSWDGKVKAGLYNDKGLLIENLSSWDYSKALVNETLRQMSSQSSLLSHLYNLLCWEYSEAKDGTARPELITSLEAVLSALYHNTELEIHEKTKDPGLEQFAQRVHDIAYKKDLKIPEKDRVLRDIRFDKWKFILTKKRAHKLGFWSYLLPLFFISVYQRFLILLTRPLKCTQSVLYKCTIGAFIWFIEAAKNNLGYSLALAIYGPFTFYFITQPMNPHAMWAVGKLRSTYLDTVAYVEDSFNDGPAKVTPISQAHASDESLKSKDPVEKHALTRGVTPKHLGLHVTSDIPSIDTLTWSDRMSHFKAMQIGYEEDMVFAARMGRLEQMENQLNFPLIAESAFLELERYYSLLEDYSNDKSLGKYIASEKKLVLLMEYYIWDRMIRYMLDHPYIVLDESNEQVQRDAYIGQAFEFTEEITHTLSMRLGKIKLPGDYKKIERLSQQFKAARKETGGIMGNLKSNSRLFQQENLYSTDELRSHMQRQWEILFLLQNKAQEAASFGLQTYVWSVRNAIWLMQTIFSAKAEELKGWKYYQKHKLWPKGHRSRHYSRLFENSFHLLVLEYVSIKKEIDQQLDRDIESVQRQKVIESLKASFISREKILKSL